MADLIGIFLVVFTIFGGLGACAYTEFVEKVNRNEKTVRSGNNLEYKVQYCNRSRKFRIELRSSRGKCFLTNKLRMVQYFPSAAVATVEMEKMKGNFL